MTPVRLAALSAGCLLVAGLWILPALAREEPSTIRPVELEVPQRSQDERGSRERGKREGPRPVERNQRKEPAPAPAEAQPTPIPTAPEPAPAPAAPPAPTPAPPADDDDGDDFSDDGGSDD